MNELQNVLIDKYGMTEELLQLRALFQSDFWLTNYMLCGFNETNVKRFPEDAGLDFPMNEELHGSICNIMQHMQWLRFLMLLPRGFFKSSIGSISYPIFNIINNPNVRICIIPGKEENGKSFIAAQQQILESPLFTALFPDIVEGIFSSKKGKKYSTLRYTVNRSAYYPLGEPTVCIRTPKQAKPSQHYDLVILDDVVNDINSQTAQERERVKTTFHNIMPLLSDPNQSRVLIIGTRWHIDDAYAEILENPNYIKLVMSITDEEGKPTFPQKYPLERIPKLKADCKTAREYAANYENNPIAEDDAPFLKKAFLRYREEVKDGRLIRWLERPGGGWNRLEPVIAGRVAPVDTAKKTGNNRDAIGVMEKDTEGRIYVPWIKVGHFSPSQRIRELNFLLKHPTLKPMKIPIEESGQHDIDSMVGDEYIRKVLGMTDKENFGEMLSPDLFLPMSHGSIEKAYRNKMAIEPFLDKNMIYWSVNLDPEIIREVMLFMQYKYDDVVDMIAYGIKAFEKLGIFGAVHRVKQKPWKARYAAAGI